MLPARITALQTQITGLNAVLADPDLYARDPGRFVATSQALAIALMNWRQPRSSG
jgi:hypothetical protein